MKKNVMLDATTTEELSNELIEKLSLYGNSYQGLCVETYAVCKAYAALKVIAQDAGWDNEPLFQKLLPWFIDESKEVLDEVNNTKNI